MSNKKKIVTPVDPDVKVPLAVRAAAERATQIHEQFYKKPDGEGQPEDPPADPAAATAPPAPAAPPPPPAPTPPTDWEAKYNQMLSSMNGRVERERSISQRLNERVIQLENLMAAQATQPTNTPAPALVKPDEVTEYGAEFLDVVGRKAAEVVVPEVAAIKNKLSELEQQLRGVGQHVNKSACERMHDALNQQLPNWTEINDNEKFLDWLALPDEYSGTIKHELLKSAYAANDAPRVLNFFKGFLASEAAAVPPVTQPDQTTPPVEPKVPLENLAAPGRAKTAAPPPAPVEKPIISSADVRQFYADLAKGVYRGRDDEKNRLEKMIFEANRDGRIR